MDDARLSFATQALWEAWLVQNGPTSSGVWLRLAKKGADCASVSYTDALETALCFGWIDGQKRAECAQHWLQRFTPRAARRIWSKINTARAEALIASGRMRPAGLAEIRRAQQDGRWDAAYPSARTASTPDDLQDALDACPKAKAFYATLNAQNRYAILFRVQNVKKAETRARKIAQYVDMLRKGEKIHP